MGSGGPRRLAAELVSVLRAMRPSAPLPELAERVNALRRSQVNLDHRIDRTCGSLQENARLVDELKLALQERIRQAEQLRLEHERFSAANAADEQAVAELVSRIQARILGSRVRRLLVPALLAFAAGIGVGYLLGRGSDAPLPRSADATAAAALPATPVPDPAPGPDPQTLVPPVLPVTVMPAAAEQAPSPPATGLRSVPAAGASVDAGSETRPELVVEAASDPNTDGQPVGIDVAPVPPGPASEPVAEPVVGPVPDRGPEPTAPEAVAGPARLAGPGVPAPDYRVSVVEGLRVRERPLGDAAVIERLERDERVRVLDYDGE